ncbi:hypothetical protein G3495_11110 [Shewanella baltica]|uniref:hypothetical protein n=1 Tax=Shewanella baltica TaxID=62322 RepID=UPI00217F11B2|nr:hypothetical protein [Shewanella baltica]MCS6235669.1 hypothetical protein [Shewanella baltica]MCS6270168.1 hypothetical protein [Shewanella baltica]
MANRGPMFDLEDCEDVNLVDNKTTSESLVKAKGTKRLTGSGNEAGTNETNVKAKLWHESAFGKVLIGLIIGGILLVARLIFGG